MISPKFWRTWHRKISILFIIPLVVISVSGFFLSLRSFSPWIQPPQLKASAGWPLVSMEDLWAKAQQIKAAELTSLSQLKSIEIKVNSGTVNFRSQNGYEIQFNAKNGEILSSAQRWTPLLAEIHEGNFLPQWLKNIFFLPAGVILTFLSISGLSMFISSNKKKKGQAHEQSTK